MVEMDYSQRVAVNLDALSTMWHVCTYFSSGSDTTNQFKVKQLVLLICQLSVCQFVSPVKKF